MSRSDQPNNEGAGSCCGSAGSWSPGPNRREFIKLAGASAAAVAATGGTSRSAAAPDGAGVAADHFVPLDKKLTPGWLGKLTEKGGPTTYRGRDLDTIGMPVGGLCAGQVYLSGDGRLTYWHIFNDTGFTGYGRDNYKPGRKPDAPLAQGFGVQITSGGKTITRTLDRAGFPDVRFCGEYPIGTVDYAAGDVPVSIRLEAFSPFVPLNAEDSSLPATLLQFTVRNSSDQPLEMTLAGWLENAVCIHSGSELSGIRANYFPRCDRGHMALGCGARETEPEKPPRPPQLVADFEADDYGDWTVDGEAFGAGPAAGTLDGQQKVSGFAGKRLVNTYLGGNDRMTGKLSSPPLTIERRFLSFLIGGGSEAGKTCINLVVDGEVVRTAVGKQAEKLEPHNWDVADLEGREARIEIIDAASGPWGHINIDQIEQRDTPRTESGGPMRERPDYGTMGLAILNEDPDGASRDVVGWASLPEGDPAEVLFQTEPAELLSIRTEEGKRNSNPRAEKPLREQLVGAIGKRLTLRPGEQRKLVFAVSWCFPNRPGHGNHYAGKFSHALLVTGYLAREFQRLDAQTRLWHRTWYDSTLPHWLLDRLFSTVSTLATGTCMRYANGRFWAWEGVGCCHGTCTHVWNYEHAMARLFPELERSCREMQDFGTGFVAETGMVRFRGEGWGNWAADGQAGTVLKALREHQMSADSAFLERNWPKIRKSLEFLVSEDRKDGADEQGGDPDGLLEGTQHNTYDINFFGANPMIGSLYLAALRAGAQMAREMGDGEFARQCSQLAEGGAKRLVERLFDGDYFIQQVDLGKHPEHQHGDGCLADQLFGQGWAHQVGLGHILPEQTVRKTLGSIWAYNWAPDIGPQNAVHRPERWFASPGEAGLFTCTWPKSPHLAKGVRYKNEVWTGIEYQVAGHMAYEGMVTEALAICRGIHERYHPAKHNPWNEIECGDHYARGMASHGVFLGLCGYEYHGPKAQLGFAPRISPGDFRAAFTAAEGWGTLAQKRTQAGQTNRVEVRWGRLPLKSLALELPDGVEARQITVTVAGRQVPVESAITGQRARVSLAEPVVITDGQALEASITF